jgi:hypothetical protein
MLESEQSRVEGYIPKSHTGWNPAFGEVPALHPDTSLWIKTLIIFSPVFL